MQPTQTTTYEAFTPHPPDEAWAAEIAMAEYAIDKLFEVMQETRAEDFRMETILWRRYHPVLWAMKRKLDAVAM